MPIYELRDDGIKALVETSFNSEGLKEKADLQRLLRDHIGIIAPGMFVLAEEYGDWEDSSRRVDLLGLDHDGNIVVVELKRESSGHMELQALRYAAMISEMTFEQAVGAHAAYLAKRGLTQDASASILEFLEWEEPDEDRFAQAVRIILASSEFSKEITTTVLWLNQMGLDISCVRLKPYKLEGRIVIDVQQVIPLPEAADYQVKVRTKAQLERASRTPRWDEPRLMKAIAENVDAVAVGVAKEILDWISPKVSYIWWGKGIRSGSFIPVWAETEEHYLFFSVYSDGIVQIPFYFLARHAPFADERLRRELMERLNRIPGVRIPEDALGGKPKFSLKLLESKQSMDMFKAAIDWAVEQA